MKERLKKLTSKGMLKRYLAMLLTIITVITTIPLSNLMSASAGTKDRTFYFSFDPGDSDSYISNTWVFWDGDLTAIAEAQKYDSVCQSAMWLVENWGDVKDDYPESKDISWSGTGNYYKAKGDFYNATPFIQITIVPPDGYHLKSVRDANGSKMAYYYDGGDTVVAECGLYVGDWTEAGSGEDRPNNGESNITLEWERNTVNVTMNYDSGVDYVGADGYSDYYNFTYNGQDHNFPSDTTLQTNVHLKDGFEMYQFKENDTVWDNTDGKDWWSNSDCPGVRFATWSMYKDRTIQILTKTTFSFEYDEGFENAAHTETVQTDEKYYDYPKLKQNYELDYVEDENTGEKWYVYDGKDSKGSYCYWTAIKPRKLKYHSKLSESAKKELNLEQNDATTKGTERVTVYQGEKIDDITIPKREYTATFFDGNKKVCSDIINKFKFLGYWNDTEGLIHTGTTSDFKNDYRPGSIGSTNTTIDGGATYEGTSTYPFTVSGKNLKTTVYAGNGDYSSARFRLDCYGFEGYVMISYKGGSDNGESWQIEAESEDDNTTIYSGYDMSAEGYGYINIKDWVEIEVAGDTSDWWTDISVVSINMTTIKKGYWYDENGKGLINYPLDRNHTIHAKWQGNDITLPEAPAKEGYTFVGWRKEDAKLVTCEWDNEDSDYLDCKNNYGGDVAKWFKASREGKTEYDVENMYLVPGSYYLNDNVIHFQYYYVDYAGDDVGLSKDTKFIACYEEIPKVTLKTSSDKGISKTYIDGDVNAKSKQVYPNTSHTVNATLNKGYKFAGWYNGNTLYSYLISKQLTMGDTDLLLVAKSNPISYKIAYNLDGGTYGTSHPDSADYDATVTIDNPSKQGYEFTGWTITGYDTGTSGHSAATWTNEKGTSYKNLTATDGATVTFTATWKKEEPKTAKYTVKHYQMNTDGTYPSTPTDTENFTGLIGSSVTPEVKDYGQIFNKPNTQTVTINADGSTVVEYKYSRKRARVIVDKSTGIKTTDPVPGYYAGGYIGTTVTLSATLETGYKFKSWISILKENYGTVFSTEATFDYTLTYNDSTAVKHQLNSGNSTMWGAYMQATAEPIIYYIKYNYDGGVKGAFAPKSAKYNEDVKISNPTKENCIFAGWTITGYDTSTSGHSAATWTNEKGTSYKNLASVDNKTVTFTANWIQKDVHLATISGRGVKVSRPVSYDGYVGETKKVTAELKPGYRFVNWTNYYTNEVVSTEQNFNYKLTDKDYENYLSDMGGTYLKSNAEPIDYTITYNLNGGTASNPASYNVETNTFTLNNPTKPGYNFTGWTGTDITGTATTVTINKGSIGNRTYTANWVAINYSITYDLDGGTVTVSNPTSYNIETPTFTLNNPVKLGYVFTGWTGSNGTTPQRSVSIYKGSTGNKSFKANWTAADVGYTVNHYVMNTKGNYPSVPTKTEKLSGFTGTSVTPDRLSLGNGFTYPEAQTVTVKADGSTVVNYYYVRNKYTIKYIPGATNNNSGQSKTQEVMYDENVTTISNPYVGMNYSYTFNQGFTSSRNWDKISSLPNGKTGTLSFAKWNINGNDYDADTLLSKPNFSTVNGAVITATAMWNSEYVTLPSVTRPGYDFTGWYSSKDNKTYAAGTKYEIIPATSKFDTTFTAQWIARKDTSYTVKHYQMNLDGTTYTLADTDNLKGTTDTLVTPSVKTYEGFTSPSTQTVTIKGDGSTVVNYYYARNKYVLDLNGLINGVSRDNLVDVVKNPVTGAEDKHTAGKAVVTVNGAVAGNNVEDFCQMIYYGSSISIVTAAESGYSIIDNGNVNFTMPAEGKSVVVTINAKDTKYLVRHWKKNVNTDTRTYDENSLNDSNYTMYDAEYLSGKAYSWVKPVIRTLEGFTYKGVLPNEGTACVKPDGTTVIDVYYTRNKYTISHTDSADTYVEYGNGISSVSGLKTYEYEQEVTLTANLKTGYHWHDTDKCASSGKYPTGWYSRNNSGVEGILTGDTTYNSQTIKFNMPARNVYLGVKATNNSYTVVYNNNQPTNPKSLSNVTGSIEIQTFIYDESQNLRNNGFSLTGYTRKSGWQTASSENGNGTADYAYGQSVKNLTTVNLGTVNLYAIWEDNTPEEINISSTNDFAAIQTVTLTAKDYGSGIDYISFGKDEKYEKVTCNTDGSVTLTKQVSASGTYTFSVKDKNGKVSKKTITFYQTTLNTNKNNIVSADGNSVIESDFTSIPDKLSTTVSINEAGKSITPVTKRDGVDFLGWSTDIKGKTGSMSIKADGNKTYYAIWKDTAKPVAVLESVTSNLSPTQTITFKLYDTAEGKTNTGSDIAGYYIGTNPDAKSNTKKSVTADNNGTYSGSETITLNEETTYYIFPYDKAGNIGDTIKLKSTGNNNTPEVTPGILFHRVDFNANGSTESPATVNLPYAVIPHGSTITMPTAYRLGYHDYTGGNEQTADNDGKTSYWGTDSKAVTGFNTLKVTKSQICYALWKANKYTITLVSNKPDTKNGYRVNSTYSPESDTKITVTFDEVIPFSKAMNPEITGWTFKGYAFNEKSTSDNNNSKNVISNSQKFGLQFVKDWYKDAGKTFENVSDITLYAAWSENRYTVNFNTAGGTALKLNRITCWYEDEFSLPDATGDYYNTFAKLDSNKKAVTTYRPAHHFVMWKCASDEASNENLYSSGAKAVRLVSKNNGECTISAVWKQKQIITLNITSDTFKESMTNDYAALADAMWAENGTKYVKDQTAIKEYTFTKTSDIKETK